MKPKFELSFEQADLERQIKQLQLNAAFLRGKIDEIHEILCPDQIGTWQQQIEQIIQAVKDLKQK